MTTQKMRISMAVLSRRAMEATVRCVTRVRAWGPSADDRGVEVARDGNGRALGERLVPWRGRRRDEEDVAGDLGTVGEGDGPEHTVLRTHGGNLVEELDVGGEALQHRKDVTRMFLAGCEQTDPRIAGLPPVAERAVDHGCSPELSHARDLRNRVVPPVAS